jgi:putative NADPH-quinone reductase
MKKVLALYGSPRPAGNTSFLLNSFIKGAEAEGATCEVVDVYKLNIQPCTGCLRCNILKRCSITQDDFAVLREKILAADVLVFASPVYFHHVTAPLKAVLDRFRSFIHVQITETGLIHTPHDVWEKDFVLLMTMGSPDPEEARPVIDLFHFMVEMLGGKSRLHVKLGTRLAVSRQVIRTEPELTELYPRLGLPVALAAMDHLRNEELLGQCRALGERLGRES